MSTMADAIAIPARLEPDTITTHPLHREQSANASDSPSTLDAGLGRARLATRGDVLSIAPMMEWTDRHYRYMARLLSKHTRLYTEMVVETTLRYSPNSAGFLRLSPIENVGGGVGCQIGGSDPSGLALAAKLVEAAGYDEVNLNCGCPSPRVAGKGCFGAALMHTPELVRDCVAAMRAAVTIPVTVKCRLGVDKLDSYEAFSNFLRVVSQSGCTHFIVHARKAFLKGLDPKANRTVPPLRYNWVQQAAMEFPHLRISINGGIVSMEQTEQLLSLQRVGPPLAFPELPPVEPRARSPARAARADGDAAGSGDRSPSPSKDTPTALPSPSPVPSTPDGVPERGDDDCPACVEDTGAGAGGEGTAAGQAHGPHGSGEQRQDGAQANAPAPTGPKEAFEAFLAADSSSPDDFKARLYSHWKSERVKKAAHDAIVGRVPPAQFHESVRQGPVQGGSYGGPQAVLDSVMIGRAAYNNSWILADVDRRLFGVPNPGHSRREVLELYVQYCERVVTEVPANELAMSLYKPFEMVKPVFGLFNGEYGCKQFRVTLCKGIQEEGLSIRQAVEAAVKVLPQDVLDEKPPV